MSTETEKSEIDTLEAVQLGGITQWIRVRGTDPSNPVLLLMQQGPGLPIINEARRFERLLGLEKDFTVVYWDQRGTGLSAPPLRKSSNPFEISAARMVDDTVSLLELLRDRFGGKTFVAGFSFGATFAAHAAMRRPDLVAALVAVGMDIDIPAAETTPTTSCSTPPASGATDARSGNWKPSARPRTWTEAVLHPGPLGGQLRRRHRQRELQHLLRALLGSLVRSPDYSVADVIRTVRAITHHRPRCCPNSPPRTWSHHAPPRHAHRHGPGPPRPGLTRRRRGA